MRAVVRRALHSNTATISLSADVAVGALIRPAPLLRQIDSAMWLSGGGNRLAAGGEAADAFCVAASIRLAPSVAAAGLPLTVFSMPPSDPSLRIFTWLSEVGGSSVTFGSAVASESSEVFATTQRKFVRVASNGRPANWSAEQRATLEADCEADAIEASNLLARLHPDLLACSADNSNALPELLRLSVPDRASGESESPPGRLLKTTVLPHNFGCAGHLDHASLFEWVHDAYVLSNSGEPPKTFTACINYFGPCAKYPKPPAMGDELEVIVMHGGADYVVRKVEDGMVPAVARVLAVA